MADILAPNDIQGLLDRLNDGGKLLVIEEKPYPAPRRLYVLHKGERSTITYNEFAYLVSHRLIQRVEETVQWDGASAEVYIAVPPPA